MGETRVSSKKRAKCLIIYIMLEMYSGLNLRLDGGRKENVFNRLLRDSWSKDLYNKVMRKIIVIK